MIESLLVVFGAGNITAVILSVYHNDNILEFIRRFIFVNGIVMVVYGFLQLLFGMME